jgi:hypothetical protein
LIEKNEKGLTGGEKFLGSTGFIEDEISNELFFNQLIKSHTR